MLKAALFNQAPQNAAPLRPESLLGPMSPFGESRAPSPVSADPNEQPGPLRGAFRERYDQVIGPQHVALMDRIAEGSGKMREREAAMSFAYKGLTFGDLQKQRDQEDVAGVATDLAAKTAGMGDGDFERLFMDLQSQLNAPPEVVAPPELKGPSLGQMAVGGLAALLMPRYAPIALAAPFQSQLRQQQIDGQNVDQSNTQNFQRWRQQIQGTGDLLDATQRRDLAQDGITARRELAADTAEARKELRSAKGSDAMALEKEKQAGRFTIAQMTVAQRREAAGRIAQNKELSEAVRLIRSVSGEARAQLAAQFRDQGVPLFQIFDGDSIAGFSDLLPSETLAEKTNELRTTRADRDRNLQKTGQLLDARKVATQYTGELAKARKEWLPKEAQARIDKMDAEEANARRRASDGYNGLTGRGAAAPVAKWLALQAKQEDAMNKVESSLVGLAEQKQAVVRKTNLLWENAKNAPAGIAGELAKQDAQKQAQALADDLDKIEALQSEKTDYLERLKAQHQSVVAALAQAPPAAAPPTTAKGGLRYMGKNLGGTLTHGGKTYKVADVVEAANKQLAGGARRQDVIERAKALGVTLQ